MTTREPKLACGTLLSDVPADQRLWYVSGSRKRKAYEASESREYSFIDGYLHRNGVRQWLPCFCSQLCAEKWISYREGFDDGVEEGQRRR